MQKFQSHSSGDTGSNMQSFSNLFDRRTTTPIFSSSSRSCLSLNFHVSQTAVWETMLWNIAAACFLGENIDGMPPRPALHLEHRDGPHCSMWMCLCAHISSYNFTSSRSKTNPGFSSPLHQLMSLLTLPPFSDLHLWFQWKLLCLATFLLSPVQLTQPFPTVDVSRPFLLCT